MIARIFNRIARTFGCTVRRIKYPSVDTSAVGQQEWAELRRIMVAYTRSHPDVGPWMRRRRLRQYLQKSRISFYYLVMDLCRERGIDLTDKRIADIGTGPGYLVRILKGVAPSSCITGFEPSSAPLALARTLCPDAEFSQLPLEEIEEAQFDVVFFTEVLEHLHRPDLALKKLAALLRPGGVLVITVPEGREDHSEIHVNFWSPQSWPEFVEVVLDGPFAITCGQLATGHNYAVIRCGITQPQDFQNAAE